MPCRASRTLFVLISASFFLFLFAHPLPASETRTGETIRVAKGETLNGNLYAAGGDVDIAGEVTGDLLIAGSHVTIPGTVGHDVATIGGELDLTGTVGGDVRIAGGQVTIGG